MYLPNALTDIRLYRIIYLLPYLCGQLHAKYHFMCLMDYYFASFNYIVALLKTSSFFHMSIHDNVQITQKCLNRVFLSYSGSSFLKKL